MTRGASNFIAIDPGYGHSDDKFNDTNHRMVNNTHYHQSNFFNKDNTRPSLRELSEQIRPTLPPGKNKNLFFSKQRGYTNPL